MASQSASLKAVSRAPLEVAEPGARAPTALTEFYRIRTISVSFSDHCNARCRYCHQSTPGFTPGEHLGPAVAARIADFCRRNSVENLIFSGGGEPTMNPDWMTIARDLIPLAPRCKIITNLARRFDEEEIATLAAIPRLHVSIDAFDRTLLRDVRQGTDILWVNYNLSRIHAHVIRRGLTMPEIKFHVVLSAEVVADLPNLVSFAAIFAEEISFIDVVLHEALLNNVTPLMSLTGAAATQAAEAIRETLRLAAVNDIKVNCPDFILEKFDLLARQGRDDRAWTSRIGDGEEGRAIFSSGLEAGETRDCDDPWSHIIVTCDGHVISCCGMAEVYGRLDDETTIDDLLQGAKARALRASLLSGDLPGKCRACGYAGITKTQTLRDRVTAMHEDWLERDA